MKLPETGDNHDHNTSDCENLDSTQIGSFSDKMLSEVALLAGPETEPTTQHQESGLCHEVSTSWIALGAWSRGVGHKKLHLPCQDRIGARAVGYDVMIGAACDGAGSAPRSGKGAELCVNAAISELERSVRIFFATNKEHDIPGPSFAEEVKRCVHHAVNAAIEREASVIGSQRREYATTLVAFVVTPAWLYVLQIGDSFVVYRTVNSPDNYCLAGEPTKGEYANETTFITDADSCEAIQAIVVDSKPVFVAASTDGLATLMLNMSEWSPHARIFERLEKFARDSIQRDSEAVSDFGLANSCEELATWLASADVIKRTDDDKSLLLAVARAEIGGNP